MYQMAAAPIPFPVHSSMLRGDALAGWLLESFDLMPPVTCALLVHGEHDNYLVTTGDGSRLVLRVHAHETTQVSRAAVEEQAGVMAALRRAGVAVETPVVRRDGHFAGAVDAPEGVRYTLLVHYVYGAAVEVAPTAVQAERYGELAGHTHAALDAIERAGPLTARPRMDLGYLLDEPLQRLQTLPGARGEARDELISLAETLKARLCELNLPETPPAWGLCHGDLHKRNVLYDGDGCLTLMDWDCLGASWRAYDLASMRRSLGRLVGFGGLEESEAARIFDAFLRGYARVRELTDAEWASIAYFVPVRHLWIRGGQAAWAVQGGWHPERYDAAWFEGLVRLLKGWMDQVINA